MSYMRTVNGITVTVICASNPEETYNQYYSDIEKRITADGYRTHEGRSLSSTGNYSMIKPEKKPCRITAIPYYTWGNRGLNQMRVWLPER